MINDNYSTFEEKLINEYKKNANPELAEVLIKEYSSHFIKKTMPSTKLNHWIKEKSSKALINPLDADYIFGLRGQGERPGKELFYICMNAFCWGLIFKEVNLTTVYHQTSKIFETSSESVQIGFERKNHDFGERELCRFGLDLYIAIHQKNITETEEVMVLDILKETIDIQMTKDLNHHRAKYMNKFREETEEK